MSGRALLRFRHRENGESLKCADIFGDSVVDQRLGEVTQLNFGPELFADGAALGTSEHLLLDTENDEPRNIVIECQRRSDTCRRAFALEGESW